MIVVSYNSIPDHALIAISETLGLTHTIQVLLFIIAHIVPATWVPCVSPVLGAGSLSFSI